MTIPAPKQNPPNEPDSQTRLGVPTVFGGRRITASVWAGRPSGSFLSGSCSEHQAPCPPTGFVKSQEGENEEGSEGELVVKFGETLPKVIQGQDIPREDLLSPGQQYQAVAELRPGLTRGSGRPRGQTWERPPQTCQPVGPALIQGDLWPTFQ